MMDNITIWKTGIFGQLQYTGTWSGNNARHRMCQKLDSLPLLIPAFQRTIRIGKEPESCRQCRSDFFLTLEILPFKTKLLVQYT